MALTAFELIGKIAMEGGASVEQELRNIGAITGTTANSMTKSWDGYGRNFMGNMNRWNGYMRNYSMSAEQLGQRVIAMSQRVEQGAAKFEQFKQATNLVDANRSFNQATSSLNGLNSTLNRLGFARTKAQIEAANGQLWAFANTRMDTLKSSIQTTEKAIKEMQASSRAVELKPQIEAAQAALATFKKELGSTSDALQKMAEVSGTTLTKAFGKDVFMKPAEGMAKLKLEATGLMNADLAFWANKTYTNVDTLGKKISQASGTIMEQKAYVMKLQTAYDTMGMTLNQRVTPYLSIAIALMGAFFNQAEAGISHFAAQTITLGKDMTGWTDKIVDSTTRTGAAYDDVGQTMSLVKNTIGGTADEVQGLTEKSLSLASVWGQPTYKDAAAQVQALDGVVKGLGVSQDQAADIMTLALKKYQGDVDKATKDVMLNADAWKAATAAGTEGANAFENATNALDSGAMAHFGTVVKQAGAALLELFQALEPTLIKVADTITNVAQRTTEFLRNNPGIATFVAHIAAAAGAMTLLVAALAPVAGFLMMHIKMFQALGQGMVAAAEGGTAVLSPAVVMLQKQFTLFTRAIAGLPAMLSNLFPAFITTMRMLPGIVGNFLVTFVKLNPMLAAFSLIAIVAAQNWDRVGPQLTALFDQIKRAFQPLFDLFTRTSTTVMPEITKVIGVFSHMAGDILVSALQTLTGIIKVVADVLNGNLSGAFKDLGSLGKTVLDALTGKLDGINPILAMIGVALGVGYAAWKTYTAAIWLANIAQIAWTNATKLAAVGQKALNLVMAANPIGIVIAIIAALVVGLITLYNTSDKARAIMDAAWNGMKAAVVSVFGFIKDFWAKWGGDITAAFSAYWEAIKSTFLNWINIFKQTFQLFANVFKGDWGAAWDNVKQIFALAWDNVKIAFGLAIKSLDTLMGGYLTDTWNLWVTNWNKVSTFFTQTWEAIKTYFTGVGEALVALFKAVWELIKAINQLALEIIKAAVEFIWNGIKLFLTATMEAIKTMIEFVWNGIKAFFLMIWNSLSDENKATFTAIAQFLSDLWSAVWNRASEAWNNIKLMFVTLWTAIKTIGTDLWNSIAQFLSDLWSAIWDRANAAWDNIKSMFSNVWEAIKKIGSDLWNSIAQFLSDLWSSIWGRASDAWNNIKAMLIGVWNAAKNEVMYVWNAVASFLSNLWSDIWNRATSAWNSITGSIKGVLQNLVNSAVGMGQNLVSGLSDGISNSASRVINAARNLASQAMSAFNRIFKPGSPSKATKYLGEMLGQGLAVGMKNTTGQVVKSAQSMAGGAMTALGGGFSPAMNFAGGNMSAGTAGPQAGRYSVEIPLYINSREVARAVAPDLDVELERKRNTSARARGIK